MDQHIASTDSLVDEIKRLDFADLCKLGIIIQREISERRPAEEAKLRDEFQAKAAVLGINPAALFGGAARSARGGPPKYRDPETGATWNGRGLGVPDWLKEKNKEDYINPDWTKAKGSK